MDKIINNNDIDKGEQAGDFHPDKQAGTSEPQIDNGRQRSGRKSQAKSASPTEIAKPVTKTAKVLKLLRSKKGASINQLEVETGWQPHSVRGFLSGTVKKKLGLTVASEIGKDGVRRYHVDESTNAN